MLTLAVVAFLAVPAIFAFAEGPATTDNTVMVDEGDEKGGDKKDKKDKKNKACCSKDQAANKSCCSSKSASSDASSSHGGKSCATPCSSANKTQCTKGKTQCTKKQDDASQEL